MQNNGKGKTKKRAAKKLLLLIRSMSLEAIFIVVPV